MFIILHNEEPQCKCIGIFMDRIFKNQYPFHTPVTETFTLSLEQLLEWDQWPIFIKELCKCLRDFMIYCTDHVKQCFFSI